MSHQEHRRHAEAAATRSVTCGVITMSDSRTKADDTGGALIVAQLTNAGHQVVRYEVIKDERDLIITLVRDLIEAGCKVIITTGGTGIARRDSTFEAIDALLEKRLPGFGEIFRMLSYEQVGAAAMLSRATAGTIGGTLVFCLPGSVNAVRLALDTLIIAELPHLVWETVR